MLSEYNDEYAVDMRTVCVSQINILTNVAIMHCMCIKLVTIFMFMLCINWRSAMQQSRHVFLDILSKYSWVCTDYVYL